jgi:sulfur carrier protein
VNIILNGDLFEIGEGSTLDDLVERLALQQKRIAIECNSEIIPRSEFGSVTLSADDKVEIVHAIGGG